MGQRSSVLVVEDDPEMNELVGAYVQIAGYHYDRALGGNEAISQARVCSPRLILLDIMLPDLDGFEVCRRLKSDQTTQGIPVVMLTCLDRDEHRRRGMECGAQAYLIKPFDPDQLLGLIRAHANGHKLGPA